MRLLPKTRLSLLAEATSLLSASAYVISKMIKRRDLLVCFHILTGHYELHTALSMACSSPIIFNYPACLLECGWLIILCTFTLIPIISCVVRHEYQIALAREIRVVIQTPVMSLTLQASWSTLLDLKKNVVRNRPMPGLANSCIPYMFIREQWVKDIARLWLLQNWMLKTPLYWIVSFKFNECSQISLL